MTAVNRSHPARRRVAIIGVLLALGTMVMAACEPPPDAPAAKLFDAWKSGKPSNATSAFTTSAAKTQIFSQAYTTTAKWAFVTCAGAAGSTYCTWVNRIEGQLVLRIDNSLNKVSSVQRISLNNESAGRLFHGWRIGDVAGSGGVASPQVKTGLAKVPYKASDHWLPEGCTTHSGSSYRFCTWNSETGKTMEFTYDPTYQWVIAYGLS